MKDLAWSPAKSEWLKRTRGVSFEEIIQAPLIGVERHPGRPHQKIMLFAYLNYIWVVPFVEGPEAYFLKTLYPSRKYTERYLKGKPQA